MPILSYPPGFDYSNYTWRRIQITKNLVMQLSPVSCHLIPLRFNILLNTLFSNTLSLCFFLLKADCSEIFYTRWESRLPESCTRIFLCSYSHFRPPLNLVSAGFFWEHSPFAFCQIQTGVINKESLKIKANYLRESLMYTPCSVGDRTEACGTSVRISLGVGNLLSTENFFA
jgi:hypothetical protein